MRHFHAYHKDHKAKMNGLQKHLFQYLYRIDLDLTGLCNKRCGFCPRFDTEKYPNVNIQMPIETVEEVIRQMRLIDFRGVVELAGRGESTLHKKFYEIVDMLSVKDKTWRLRLTTNGRKIETWWDDISPKLDYLILNSYDSQEQYDERLVKYRKLFNGNLVDHNYKPENFTIEQINKIKPFRPTDVENPNFSMKYQFNNRAGFFSDEMLDAPCFHPMRQIFIDYNSNYQMCCNDWNSQIILGNILERDMIDIYLNDPKLARIRWMLMNTGRRDILPCSRCNDSQGNKKDCHRTIKIYKRSKSYKFHLIPLAREGKIYDDDLKKGI